MVNVDGTVKLCISKAAFLLMKRHVPPGKMRLPLYRHPRAHELRKMKDGDMLEECSSEEWSRKTGERGEIDGIFHWKDLP